MMKTLMVLIPALSLAFTALAESPSEILDAYRQAAKAPVLGPGSFSAERGRALYANEQKSPRGPISCATCHTTDPRRTGMTRANKAIEPLAPSANAKRFTDRAKVEKWFARNCDDVLRRPCSALEKGDFLTYLLSIK